MHSFRLQAVACDVIHLVNPEQLPNLPKDAYVLGEGTNTVFLSDFDRPIVKVELKGIKVQEQRDHWLVSAAAGENWHELVCELLRLGIYGLENLALIPGTVGAAPVQNIGAYGREAADFISHVKAWNISTRQVLTLPCEQCEFGYRDSRFKREAGDWLIVEVQFQIPKLWQPEISYGELQSIEPPITALKIFNTVIATRQRKLPDPKELPNAGSFFKNPLISESELERLLGQYPKLPNYRTETSTIKVAAGWLIDNLGLKGYQLGQVAVHKNQALVLVNYGNATGDDLRKLARYIQQRVYEEYGINIEPEVRLLGRNGLESL